MIGFPKPERRATTKRRRANYERIMVRTVRAHCVERDGHCRVALDMSTELLMADKVALVRLVTAGHACAGPSEWAHFGAQKRFKTRGQAPDQRHTTASSLMLCTLHHREYDQGRLQIQAKTEAGCNGPLTYRRTA